MTAAEPTKATRPYSSNTPTDHERAFVEHLIRLLGPEHVAPGAKADRATRADRASLAALRRGLGKEPGEAAEMFPYVIPWCGNEPEYRQNDYFLVTALFASHQGRRGPHAGINSAQRNSLGGSFELLAKSAESGSIEKRFVALLNASREDLTSHLRYAISLLKAHEIGVDWAQLLHDLRGWEWSGRSVQRRWAEGYWYADYGNGNQQGASATPPAS
jgi:CRISPR system Cascade subunit CasB